MTSEDFKNWQGREEDDRRRPRREGRGRVWRGRGRGVREVGDRRDHTDRDNREKRDHIVGDHRDNRDSDFARDGDRRPRTNKEGNRSNYEGRNQDSRIGNSGF